MKTLLSFVTVKLWSNWLCYISFHWKSRFPRAYQESSARGTTPTFLCLERNRTPTRQA